MPIAITDDHQELAADGPRASSPPIRRSRLPAPCSSPTRSPGPPTGAKWRIWAGSGSTCPRSTEGPGRDCRSWWSSSTSSAARWRRARSSRPCWRRRSSSSAAAPSRSDGCCPGSPTARPRPRSGWARRTSHWPTGRLRGDAGTVLGGRAADLLLLRVGDDVVIAHGRNAPGLTLSAPPDLDPTRRSVRVTADGVAVAPSDVLPGAADRAVALARTLGAAEAVGGAAACVDDAVDYAKQRVQFGRTIGTFQAIKHHCANMLVAAELATAVVWDAARASVDGERRGVLARGGHGGHAGLRAFRAQRPDEHPGARGHRLHLGARCPSLSPARRSCSTPCWVRRATSRT